VLLNLIFNGVKGERAAKRDIRRAGHDFDGRGGNDDAIAGDEMLRAADMH
jgi:NCS2 family nucleobase:cation symporter-2